jgi:voltage-gated potassium channel
VKSKLTREPLRHRLARVLEPYGSPGSTRLNLLLDLFLLLCIIISCLLVPLEHYYPEHQPLLWAIEVSFAVFFAGEYLLRWYAAEQRWRYPFTFLAIIDLLAILPTLLMLSSQAMALRLVRGFRILRLLRLIRLLRLLRYGFWVHRAWVSVRIWGSALNQTYRLAQLGRLFGWLCVAWLIGANMLFVTESNLAPRPGPFSDYWTSYWHILIALVSGIEDKEPLSLLGRIEMTVMLITGLCVVGMFTGEIVSILVKKAQRAGKLVLKPPRARFERHILILGENTHLDNVIRQVSAAYRHRPHIVVVCPNADELKIGEPKLYRKVYAVAGDPVDVAVLDHAAVDNASRVIVLSSDRPGCGPPSELDSRALMQTLAVVARRRADPLPIVVELQSDETLDFARPLTGIDLLVGRHYGEKLISQAVLNPGITEVYVELMTFTDQSTEFYLVPVPPHLRGKSYQDAQLAFLDYDDEDMVLTGIDRSPPDQPTTRFVLNPTGGATPLSEEELVLRADDRLILLAYERPTFATISTDDRWSGRVIERS